MNGERPYPGPTEKFSQKLRNVGLLAGGVGLVFSPPLATLGLGSAIIFEVVHSKAKIERLNRQKIGL